MTRDKVFVTKHRQIVFRQRSGLGAVRRRLRPVVPHALRGAGARRAARRRRVRVRRLRGAPGAPRRPQHRQVGGEPRTLRSVVLSAGCVRMN